MDTTSAVFKGTSNYQFKNRLREQKNIKFTESVGLHK